ncbi:hypothetical protein M758_7G155700 [Ceratodon purpureus]|nr:hypothetical protein M758_7G155700 [Ceratodon purpureus]
MVDCAAPLPPLTLFFELMVICPDLSKRLLDLRCVRAYSATDHRHKVGRKAQ